MDVLEMERICEIGAFSPNRFWAISGTAVLSATIRINEIKVRKLKPPDKSRSSNNDHVLRLAHVSKIPQ
jgi:hypothetical protein